MAAYKPSIKHKGLLIVGIPVVVVIAFIFILASTLTQWQRQTAWEYNNRALGLHATRIRLDTFSAYNELLEWVQDPNEQRYKRYKDKLEELSKHAQSLHKIRVIEPLQPFIDRLRLQADRAVDMLSSIEERRKPEALFMSALRLSTPIGECMREISKEEASLTRRHSTGGSADPELEIATQRGFFTILLSGGVVSILVSLVLAYFFTVSVSNRLAILTENTKRFSSKEPLLPPVSGNDEIADLDAVFHDMTQKLTEAARMKQEFFAMISHDLRTPLTSLHALITLLATGTMGELSEKAQRRLRHAENDLDRLLMLINDLLDAERLEQGKLSLNKRSTSVKEILGRSLRSVSSLSESRSVNIELPDEDVELEADEDRLIQVVVNLLSNAIKYSPEGESIQIALSIQPSQIEVSILDRGPGVPDETKQTIFERFRQSKASDASHGSGLGLFISKEIVTGHGGKIGVSDRPGGGSIFWFTLPKV